MDSFDALLKEHLDVLDPKASFASRASDKKRYSELMSQQIALALAEGLRARGLTETYPTPSSEGRSGAERRMAGGIGAKKVDVTWATEESGLLFSASIKTINWKDGRSGTYQKNLTNRRGDMLFEAVTLHQRFPYAVLFGFLFLDDEARADDTERRNSTFENAHQRLLLFSDRDDPGDRDERYERLFVVLVDAAPGKSRFECYPIGDLGQPVALDSVFADALRQLAERNPDFYEVRDGRLVRL